MVFVNQYLHYTIQISTLRFKKSMELARMFYKIRKQFIHLETV